MRLLSIDPGFCHTGYTVYDISKEGVKLIGHGCVSTAPSNKKLKLRVADDTARRVQELVRGLRQVIVDNNVSGLAAELPSGGSKSAAAGKAMGIAIAVSAALAEFEDLPCEWVSPGDVKKALAGVRTASKEQMQKRALGHFPELDAIYRHSKGQHKGKLHSDFEHIADSIGVFKAVENGSMVRMFKKS
jgi:Holliday junction resolvasome RuvABC endonuclease subunit